MRRDIPPEKNLELKNVGTINKPVIYESYPGENAIFDGKDLPIHQFTRINIAGKFIQFRDIEVRNMPTQGLYVTGSDNIIEGSHIHHNKLSGIWVFAEKNNSWQYSDNVVFISKDPDSVQFLVSVSGNVLEKIGAFGI